MLHSIVVARPPELGQVNAAGLADRVDNHDENKIDLIGYVHRGHADVPQARNHKVVNQRDHAHNELLEHDR